MQTFLPYPNFERSASCLDNKRVNKQIIEADTILSAIIDGNGWSNHPIVKMWKGYPDALILYYNAFLYEWKEVRHRNHVYLPLEISVGIGNVKFPEWFGDERLHSSHRANLLRKDYEFYSKYGWKENNMDYSKMPYWWGEEYGYGKIPVNKVRGNDKNRIEIDGIQAELMIKKNQEWKPKKFVIKRKKEKEEDKNEE